MRQAYDYWQDQPGNFFDSASLTSHSSPKEERRRSHARHSHSPQRARQCWGRNPHCETPEDGVFSFSKLVPGAENTSTRRLGPPPHDSLILSIFHCAADALKADSLTLESNSRKRAFQRQRACCKQCQRRLQARTLRGGRAKRLTRSCELFSVFNVDPAGKHTNINVLRARTSNCVQTLFCTLLNFRELEHDFASLLGAEGTVAAAHFSNFCHFFFFFRMSGCFTCVPAGRLLVVPTAKLRPAVKRVHSSSLLSSCHTAFTTISPPAARHLT